VGRGTLPVVARSTVVDLADADLAMVQDLARRRWPHGRHPGGLAWEVTTDGLADVAVAWIEGDAVVGWSAVGQPEDLIVEVAPGRIDVAKTALDWALDVATGPTVSIAVADADTAVLAVVADAGFAPMPDARPGYGMRRRAVPADDRSPPPAGYVIRPTTPEETKARVAVHREAWAFDSLPWHPDHRPPMPGAADMGLQARLQREARVRAAPLYDMDLDLVIEAPDGTLAGCCIVWFDASLGSAEIEPLGIVPAHRRRGLARALCHDVVARVAARGGREVFINNGPNVAYPAPAGAYAKAGFVGTLICHLNEAGRCSPDQAICPRGCA
jgi:ribosomal protein S18 acetylase RimI-like enzyme